MRSTPSNGSEIREALENLRDAVMARTGGMGGGWSAWGDNRGATGGGRGDLRTAILAALGGEAKNGHQVMQAIAAASGGAWMPTAGQVYPMLQQLTDEGLLSAHVEGERTVYALTDAGREAAAAAHDASSAHDGEARTGSRGSWPSNGWTMPEWRKPDWTVPDWADRMSGRINDRMTEHRAAHTTALPRAGAKLAQAAAQVASTGSKEQQERAAALLDETRRKLYAILAEEPTHGEHSEHAEHGEHGDHTQRAEHGEHGDHADHTEA